MTKGQALPSTLQALPAEAARLCLLVRDFLQGILKRAGVAEDLAGLPVAVGFSGGADSTALAIILRCLGCAVTLAHVDHGLRPESAAEAEAAVAFAARLGVPCRVRRTAVAALAQVQGCGLEEAGRQARYAFFGELLASGDAGWIATGHHLDDLGEDVLLRLTRGTGWPGLGGMPAVDVSRRLVRPLLTTQREAVERFLKALGETWLEDASNQRDDFRRNRIRHHVLPLLKAENPAFSRSVQTLWTLAREDEAYWDALLAPVFAQVRDEGGLMLPRAAFLELPRAARLRVYVGLIRRFGCGQAQAETLFRLDEAATSSRSPRRFQFPGCVTVLTDAAGLRVMPSERRLP